MGSIGGGRGYSQESESWRLNDRIPESPFRDQEIFSFPTRLPCSGSWSCRTAQDKQISTIRIPQRKLINSFETISRLISLALGSLLPSCLSSLCQIAQDALHSRGTDRTNGSEISDKLRAHFYHVVWNSHFEVASSKEMNSVVVRKRHPASVDKSEVGGKNGLLLLTSGMFIICLHWSPFKVVIQLI